MKSLLYFIENYLENHVLIDLLIFIFYVVTILKK